MGKFNFRFKETVVIRKVLTPRIGMVEINPDTIMLWLSSFGVNPCFKSAVVFSFTLFNFAFKLFMIFVFFQIFL